MLRKRYCLFPYTAHRNHIHVVSKSVRANPIKIFMLQMCFSSETKKPGMHTHSDRENSLFLFPQSSGNVHSCESWENLARYRFTFSKSHENIDFPTFPDYRVVVTDTRQRCSLCRCSGDHVQSIGEVRTRYITVRPSRDSAEAYGRIIQSFCVPALYSCVTTCAARELIFNFGYLTN